MVSQVKHTNMSVLIQFTAQFMGLCLDERVVTKNLIIPPSPPSSNAPFLESNNGGGVAINNL